MLSVVNQPFMLSGIILNASMLSVVAPQKILCNSVVFESGKMLLLSNIFCEKLSSQFTTAFDVWTWISLSKEFLCLLSIFNNFFVFYFTLPIVVNHPFYARFHYPECHYAECRGTPKNYATLWFLSPGKCFSFQIFFCEKLSSQFTTAFDVWTWTSLGKEFLSLLSFLNNFFCILVHAFYSNAYCLWVELYLKNPNNPHFCGKHTSLL
jgi:hypothetical protein